MADYENVIALVCRTKRVFYPESKTMYAGTFRVVVSAEMVRLESILSGFKLYGYYPAGVTAETTLARLLGL